MASNQSRVPSSVIAFAMSAECGVYLSSFCMGILELQVQMSSAFDLMFLRICGVLKFARSVTSRFPHQNICERLRFGVDILRTLLHR